MSGSGPRIRSHLSPKPGPDVCYPFDARFGLNSKTCNGSGSQDRHCPQKATQIQIHHGHKLNPILLHP